jgi:hypothetical protein
MANCSNAKALGWFVVALDGRTETEASERVVQLAGLVTTLWPILFATVVGNAIKAYANYQAERGAHLLVRTGTAPIKRTLCELTVNNRSF